jgi:hypothetical protein
VSALVSLQHEDIDVLGGVFICYRREDSAGFARLIYDRLTNKLGRERVFFDVDNIAPGVDFVDILSERVAKCDALIAVIGRHWTSSVDIHNRRRLDDPDDFVRIEIEAALERKIRVIPVLVDGAIMPRSDDLPDRLKKLRRRQAIEISHNHRFDSDVEGLTRALSALDEELRQLEPAERAPIRPQTVGQKHAATIEKLRAAGAWEQVVIDACKQFGGSTIQIRPNINEKKLANARTAFKIPSDEDILALLDTTTFGSNKTGVAFGYRGLYWRNICENGRSLPWGELYDYKFSPARVNIFSTSGADIRLYRTMSNGFLINDFFISTNINANIDEAGLFNLLKSI